MFTPTKEELEKLGFEKSLWIDVYWYKGYDYWYSITIKYGIVDINWKKLYPQSIEDIETLIRMFTR